MKAAPIFGLVLCASWLGIAEPGRAMSLQLPTGLRPAASLRLPVRHHHHHRWYRRHRSKSGIEYYSLYPDAAAGEGQSGPPPPDLAGGGAYGRFPGKPSIRWVDPGRQAR